jgi:uncharacterized protein (TIGR02246 family)
MSPIEVVAAQLDAYNAQDLDAFCALFAEDCVIADFNGAVTQTGLAAVRERYARLFAQYPENRARIVNRIAVGDIVVDLEDITRSAAEHFTAAAIYTVRNGRIARVDFVRET